MILSGDVRAATLELTGAQIDTLFGTPVTIVAAPGAGLVVVPIQVVARLVRGTVAWSNSRNLQIQYDGDTTNLIANVTILFANGGGSTLDQLFHASRATNYSGANNFNPSNTPVEVTIQTGDISLGSASDRLRRQARRSTCSRTRASCRN
jgi:hypothetical protein